MDGRQHQFASVRYIPGNRNNGVNIVNFEKHQQYLSEDRECAECFFAGNCLGAIQKVCHRTTTDFWPPCPPCYTLSLFALTPLPPCHHQNSDKLWADNKPTFDANFLLSAWNATLKSKWSGAITTLKVILMRLLKRYFFEVVTSLFGLTPSPLSQFVTILLDHPPPRPVTYFLNGPLVKRKQ